MRRLGRLRLMKRNILPLTSLVKPSLLSLLLLLSSLTNAQSLEARYQALPANVPLETALLQKTNQARVSNGLTELEYDEQLALAARAHASEMVVFSYFSHQSPNPSNASPAMRVANAGSVLVFTGENIAKMPAGDIPTATTEGWMNSPGHRANILEPNYTHVGFGTALDSQGFTYVVQVFAYQPFKLIKAETTVQTQLAYDIVFNAQTNSAATAIFSYGQEQSQPIALQAGNNSVALLSLEKDKVYLQGSVLAAVGGGYIIQDGGWLDLTTNSYLPDEFLPKQGLNLSSVAAYSKNQVVYLVDLGFQGQLSPELAVFLGDEYQQNVKLQGNTVQLSIPESKLPTIIGVGEVFNGSQVRITHQIKLEGSNGQARLLTTAER